MSEEYKQYPAKFDERCDVCRKECKQGTNRYLQKVGEKWIHCVDLECFKIQGAKPSDSKQKFQRKVVTPDEARALSQKIWSYALEDAGKVFPPPPMSTATDLSRQTQIVDDHKTAYLELAKVFYKGMTRMVR